jgi:hypothetical protein
MQITNEPDGVTVITGTVADQAALLGLLAKVRDLGLSLLSVRHLGPERVTPEPDDSSFHVPADPDVADDGDAS